MRLPTLSRFDIAGVTIHAATGIEVLRSITASSMIGTPSHLAFCNAHMLALALEHPDYAAALTHLDLMNDGVGLDLAARLLIGRRFPENLNGTDFIPKLLDSVPSARIFLLGAGASVAATAADRIAERFPQHTVVGFQDGYFPDEAVGAIIERINTLRTEILLVAMGNPRQEFFVARHHHRIGASLTVCCGALFDRIAGKVPRAPSWMRRHRLEWIFRVVREPRRLGKRYTVEAGTLALRLLKLRLTSTIRSPAVGATNLKPLPHPVSQSRDEGSLSGEDGWLPLESDDVVQNAATEPTHESRSRNDA